jgi:alpha-beta hydrolase superfamily lysophospholipase
MVAAAGTPVVFIHGLWLHADSWGPWVDRFREAGYAPSAPGWPGEGTIEETRQHPERVGGRGIEDVVTHYAQHIATLDRPPIVVGHSFGGLVAQRLLGQGVAVAGVAIDAAPIKGVLFLPPSALRVASVALRNPLNRGRAVALTRGQFRYGFGNALTQAESDELFERWAIASPGRPLFEAAIANLTPRSPAQVDTSNATRGPLLLTAGGEDHTVPPAITRQTQKLYEKSGAVTDVREFPTRGHSLTIDSGWQEVADAVLEWLGKQPLATSTA